MRRALDVVGETKDGWSATILRTAHIKCNWHRKRNYAVDKERGAPKEQHLRRRVIRQAVEETGDKILGRPLSVWLASHLTQCTLTAFQLRFARNGHGRGLLLSIRYRGQAIYRTNVLHPRPILVAL